MKKRWTIYCTVVILTTTTHVAAQDPHFSQFFQAPLLRNPSLAGIFDGDIRVQGVYRSQWGSVTVPYQTGSFDVEYKQPIGSGNDFITTGLQLLYDKAGTIDFTTTSILPAINYHKSLSDDKLQYLSLGFMGGYVQRRIDRTKVTTNNQFDVNGYNPSLSDGELFAQNSYGYFDGSIGMSYNAAINGSKENNYYIGVAYHHLNRPKNSFYKNPAIELYAKWQVSGGLKVSINEVSFMTLYADYSRQGTFSETTAGGLYGYKIGADYENPAYIFYFGGFIRWADAFIPVVKFDYNPFSITFSYDANISQVKTAAQSLNAVEISVAYKGFTNRNNTTRNAVLCPKF